MASIGRILLGVVVAVGLIVGYFFYAAPGEAPVTGSARSRDVPRPAPEPTPIPAPELAEPELSGEDAIAEAKAIYNAELKLFDVGAKQMGKLRKSDRIELREQCVDLMGPALEEAKALDRRADVLSSFEFSRLRLAAGYMTQCVTCTPQTARFNCIQAQAELKGFRKEFEG